MLANLLRTRWFAPMTATAIVAVLALTLLIVLVVSNLGDDSRPGQLAPVATPPDSSPPAEKPPEGMIEIPAGNVVLGADEGRLRSHARSLDTLRDKPDLDSLVEQFVELCNDSPHRTVAVEAFWIDQYEVTNAEYAKFVADTGQPPPSDWPNRSPAPGTENHPVTHVSHEDAAAYAKWAGKLLPTEAQWLRAYRADTEYMYPWGDLWEERRIGAFPAVQDEELRPVDAFPDDRTTFGVIGMVGNACEYVRDRSRLNGISVATIKGSDCASNGDIYSAAPACRQAAVDDGEQPTIGFRCVIEKAR